MELVMGRPATNEGRLDKEIRVYDFLDELGISYQRIDHEPAMTMEICAQIDKVLEATICKNLLLCNRQKTDFYLLMMPGDKVFKTKELSGQIVLVGVTLTAPAGRYLAEDLGSLVGMDHIHHLAQLTVFVLIVSQQRIQTVTGPPGIGIGDDALGDDQTEAASCTGGIPGIGLLGRKAHGTGVAHVHR